MRDGFLLIFLLHMAVYHDGPLIPGILRVERKLLENAAPVDVDQEWVKTLEPIQCPPCKTSNQSSFLQYSGRSTVPGREGAMGIE